MRATRSLHLGVDVLGPSYPVGSTPLCQAANDAMRWCQIAQEFGGFDPVLLQNASATRAALIEWFDSVVTGPQAAVAGDVLMLTFAGHGTQTEELVPGPDGEFDQLNEQFVLYDQLFLDDEMNAQLRRLPVGVGIILAVDSCHSQTIAEFVEEPIDGARKLIASVARAILEQSAEMYEAHRAAAYATEPGSVRAEVVTVSACRDHQIAFEDHDGGRFTKAVQALMRSEFAGDYLALEAALQSRVMGQTPSVGWLGNRPALVSAVAFEKQRP